MKIFLHSDCSTEILAVHSSVIRPPLRRLCLGTPQALFSSDGRLVGLDEHFVVCFGLEIQQVTKQLIKCIFELVNPLFTFVPGGPLGLPFWISSNLAGSCGFGCDWGKSSGSGNALSSSLSGDGEVDVLKMCLYGFPVRLSILRTFKPVPGASDKTYHK